MVIKTSEITRHRIAIHCKAFKPADKNLTQTLKSEEEKINKKHNKQKTQNNIGEIRSNKAIITININGLN